MGFTLSNLRYFIFTESKHLSHCSCSTVQVFLCCLMSWIDLPFISDFWPCHCLSIDLHTALKGWSFHIVHRSCCSQDTVTGEPILCYLQLPSTSAAYVSHYHVCVCCSIESKFLASFMLSNASFCVLWASTLCAHNSVHSLVASLMFSSADTSSVFYLSYLHHLAQV